MPRWLNRFSYRLVAELLWHAFRKATNAVPSVVVPFAADQFFGAEQLRQRGVAPATGSLRNVTPATLARAILSARTAEMREQASAVGEKMRVENGLATAVGRVHALMAS
jgi:sterol 3beta-glucosyltransferase